MTILRKTFSGNGRPRKATKQNVGRYPSGQTRHADRGEKPEDAMRTAIDARVRTLQVPRKEADNPLLGSALGRLRYLGTAGGGISREQFDAGQKFATVMACQGILDDLRPAYGIPVLARLSCPSGQSPYDRIDPDLAWDETERLKRLKLIEDTRRAASEATSALWELQAFHNGAAYVVTRVCLWDDITAVGGEAKMGALRCGLNALARIWKLDGDRD